MATLWVKLWKGLTCEKLQSVDLFRNCCFFIQSTNTVCVRDFYDIYKTNKKLKSKNK